MEIRLSSPVTDFPGVGEVRGAKLAKLGLGTAGDLLGYFPRDYEDRRKLCTVQDAPTEGKVCIEAIVTERPRLSRIRKGLDLVQVRAADHTGVLHLTFFNQPYVEKNLKPGEEYVFYGAVEEQGRRRSMTNPVFEPAGRQDVTGRILPVYPLTAGITNHLLGSMVRRALPCAGEMEETLPNSLRQNHALAGLEFALKNIHFPEGEEELNLARRRLMFEELFYLSIGLTFLKHRREGQHHGIAARPFPVEEFTSLLPFAPTAAQRRVMEEIAADMTSGRPMNRLVQGDVGSGKTAVAAFAACLMVKSGGQCALMAPTEVLAEQHYRSLSALLDRAGVRVGLLTGSLTAAEKRNIRKKMENGEVDLVIGTHALISEGVKFNNLSLIIADEQHRFGVAQRAALAGKSGEDTSPHVLVMSATPIPRTLALIVYGDLDVSVIDQLPPGRTPVETYVIREDKRERMYGFVRKQVEQGRQVYLICPAVEENPELLPGAPDLKAVKTYAEKLSREVFPDLKVGILHGKMKPKEKEAVMVDFAEGTIQILVATTVVEVGVDVPNASLIVIEGADRFGLSQLHQLRGRVGRGKHQSYCVLVTDTRNPDSLQRLRVLASTTDGFKIAEEDLKLRGPGDFFGSRQHGMPAMRLADLTGDMRLLQESQQAALTLLADDPGLEKPENRGVLLKVRQMFADTPDIFN